MAGAGAICLPDARKLTQFRSCYLWARALHHELGLQGYWQF